ncbi:unnamed protein product [Closterium sp. NIES-64]|nr:unnamed protein product [Closterium sp. NIES-64]
MPETTSTLQWTGKVGDASAFRVWGSRAFVRDLSADKLSSRAIPCVFLGFPPDAAGWQFYHPTLRRPPPVDPLPAHGPAPSGVSQVDALEPVKVAVDSSAARGAEPAGAGSGGAEPERAEHRGVEPGGAEPGGAELGVAQSFGCFVLAGATLSRGSCTSGLLGAGAVLLELVVLRALEVLLLLELLGVLEPLVTEMLVLEALELLGLVLLVGLELQEVLAVALLELLGLLEVLLELELPEVLELEALQEPVLHGVLVLALLELQEVLLVLVVLLELEPTQGVLSQSQLQPASPLPAPSPYTGPTGGLKERHEPESRPASPVRRVPLPSPPASSLPALADPESDSLRASSPTVTHLLATVVTDPSFESSAAFALVAELVDFAAHYRLDYAASLVAESESVCPLSVGGECALSTDVLEDRQEEFECFAAALPHLVSMLLAPEGDPDAPNIPTPRSYAKAIEGPYSSQ